MGWPHFSFLFGLVFLFIFRVPIRDFLSRVTSIEKIGLKTQPVPEVQREKKKNEAAQELLIAIGNSIVLSDIELRIRTDLTGRGLDVEGETVKVVVKLLAATKILLEFEQIHNLIFGSQILLLKKLNEVRGQGKSNEFVSGHFDHIKEIFPAEFSDWKLDQYLAFLLDRMLIILDGGNYHITNLGVEYLTWVARNGSPENKPL